MDSDEQQHVIWLYATKSREQCRFEPIEWCEIHLCVSKSLIEKHAKRHATNPVPVEATVQRVLFLLDMLCYSDEDESSMTRALDDSCARMLTHPDFGQHASDDMLRHALLVQIVDKYLARDSSGDWGHAIVYLAVKQLQLLENAESICLQNYKITVTWKK